MINESNLIQLYNSAVKAFPNTQMRQHATDPVDIIDLDWVPFLGLNTLFVKARVRNENREYGSMILFKKVKYEGGANSLHLKDKIGIPFTMQKLKENQEVLVRCGCDDFKWRFNFYDHIDYSLYGRKTKEYHAKTSRKANPLELPGMCKHLMKMAYTLSEEGLFI